MSINLNIETKYLAKPELYEPSSAAFWDDEYISSQMLQAHLNPYWDAATRNHAFVDKSAEWITCTAPPEKYCRLLDLGCGPGLYAERFSKAGYSVVGVDFSRRSVEYAKEQTALNKSNIEYRRLNYLELDYREQFDVATLIYCDYAVLSLADRIRLLKNAYNALKKGGKLFFDVFTERERKPESQQWSYSENGGFYTPKPCLCLESVYQYEEDKTELCRAVVVTEDGTEYYNIYDHFFTKEKLDSEIRAAGFCSAQFFGDIAGAEYDENGSTIAVVLTK